MLLATQAHAEDVAQILDEVAGRVRGSVHPAPPGRRKGEGMKSSDQRRAELLARARELDKPFNLFKVRIRNGRVVTGLGRDRGPLAGSSAEVIRGRPGPPPKGIVYDVAIGFYRAPGSRSC